MSDWLMSALGYAKEDIGVGKKITRESDKKPEKKNLPTFSVAQVAEHKESDDCWMIVDGQVYDLSLFVDEHPGGDILLDFAGDDATDIFYDIGHSYEAKEMLHEFHIGTLA